MNQTISPFEVYIRIRPLSETEQSFPRVKSSKIVTTNQGSISNDLWLQDPSFTTKRYAFDGVFNEDCNNKEVYDFAIEKLIESLSNGYNATCFAYGNTGAGKTHTMFGHITSLKNNERGIVFLALEGCFKRFSSMSKVCLKASYLEIYNENVKDLLNPQDSKGLMIIEDPSKGILVPELREFEVENLEQLYDIVLEGNKNRTFASTSANELSTRSHAILQLNIEQSHKNEIISSRLCMIDLAGSERGASTDNKGQRMVEGAMINKSLLALGNCINILSDDKKKGRYVPYRDSKLTRLLKDSLGGNTRTTMIACIIPAAFAYEDTYHTLKYAQRVKLISTKVSKTIKEVQYDYKDIINSLRSEIETLKIQLKRQEDQNSYQDLSIEDEKDEEKYKNLSRLLRTNFEEHWELKQSIKEIEALNEQNRTRLKYLVERIEAENNDKEICIFEDLKNELQLVQENIRENEENRNELLQAMYANMKQKQTLQKEMGNVKDSKKRDLLELQIAVRTLKLEKLDLHMQNLELQKKAEESEKISEEKDKIIQEMKKEIDNMKRRIKSRQNSLLPLQELEMNEENLKPDNLYDSLGDTIRVIPTKLSNPSPKVTKWNEIKISHLSEARNLRKSGSKNLETTSKATAFLEEYKTVKDHEVYEEINDLTKVRSSSVLPKNKINYQNSEEEKTPRYNAFGKNKISTKKGAFSLLYPSIPRSISLARSNSTKTRKQPYSSQRGYKPSLERAVSREYSPSPNKNDENNPAKLQQNIRDATRQLIPNKTTNLIRKLVSSKLIPRAK
ncbi:unnamed protein product [Blepharisma stoltei]|uniref:Kinesin-like protein n=1 Tax=Blepharisma stoltei TaxID=1481888 RepID=A0AAU9IGU2_9CILI|nr:unnamed protein product [Blepharisma stoltei]